MQINLRFTIVLLIVGVIHFIFIFYTQTKQQVESSPITESAYKVENIKIQLKKRLKTRTKSKDISKSSRISFEDLRWAHDQETLPSFGNEQGSKVRCLDELVSRVGKFPRGFYHRKITGSSELRVQVSQDNVILNLSNDEHWLIGGLLCEQMRALMNKLKGSTCLKSLVSQSPVYLFSYRLTLSLGQTDGEEFSVSTDNNFSRKITKMAKNSAWQPLKIISNVGSAFELFESDTEKREWEILQNRLRRLNCRSLRIEI